MEGKRILNMDEACAVLGYKKSYLYKLTSCGVIPHSKPNGKKIFFDRETLEKWIMRNQRVVDMTTLADTYLANNKF
jgi:excisionase family DNA binding protein